MSLGEREGASPSVSVITPVFRAADYVEEAVRSALDEPETLEVILVEDGSDDAGLDVCRRLAEDPRVHLLRHPGGVNQGPSASRNLALSHARGRYVAMLDSDDYFLPGRLAGAVSCMEADPRVDGVYEAVGAVFESEEARQVWQRSLGGEDLSTLSRRVEPEGLLSAILLEGAGMFCTDGVVVRRAVFDRVGLFRTDLRIGEDTEMWWRLAAACRLVPGTLDRAVAIRRRHAANSFAAENPQYAGAAHRVALSVYRWSFGMRLGRDTRYVLLKALLGSVFRPGRADGSRAWGVTTRLFRTLVACPWLPATPELWRVLGDRVRRLFGF